jgi:hypothetical protein
MKVLTNGLALFALATATASAGQLRGGVRDGAGSDGYWLPPSSSLLETKGPADVAAGDVNRTALAGATGANLKVTATGAPEIMNEKEFTRQQEEEANVNGNKTYHGFDPAVLDYKVKKHFERHPVDVPQALLETMTKVQVKGDDQAYWLPPASGAPAAGSGGGKGGAMQPAPSSPYTSQFSVNPQSFYGSGGGSFLEEKAAHVAGATGAHLKVAATGAPEIIHEKAFARMEEDQAKENKTYHGFDHDVLKYKVDRHFERHPVALLETMVKVQVKGDDQAYWLPPASGAPAAGGGGGKGGAMQPAPSSPYTSQFSVNPQSFYGAGGGSFLETGSKATSKMMVKVQVKGDDQAYWLPPASGAPAAGGGGDKGGAMQPAPSSPYTSQFSVNPQSFYGAGGK